jgi:hypothetical protein
LDFVDVVSGPTAELDLGNGAIAEFTINKLN